MDYFNVPSIAHPKHIFKIVIIMTASCKTKWCMYVCEMETVTIIHLNEKSPSEREKKGYSVVVKS